MINRVISIFFRNETSGMTSKGFMNTLKLGSVYACGRITLDLMESDLPEQEQHITDFVVNSDDVKAVFEFVKKSMVIYKSLKVGFTRFCIVFFNFPLIRCGLLNRLSMVREKMRISWSWKILLMRHLTLLFLKSSRFSKKLLTGRLVL